MKLSVFRVIGYTSLQPEFAVVELTRGLQQKILDLQAVCYQHSLAEARVNLSAVGLLDTIRWIYADSAPVLAGTQLVVTQQSVFFDNAIERDDADPLIFNTKPVQLSTWLQHLEASGEDPVLMEERGSEEFQELEERVRELNMHSV